MRIKYSVICIVILVSSLSLAIPPERDPSPIKKSKIEKDVISTKSQALTVSKLVDFESYLYWSGQYEKAESLYDELDNDDSLCNQLTDREVNQLMPITEMMRILEKCRYVHTIANEIYATDKKLCEYLQDNNVWRQLIYDQITPHHDELWNGEELQLHLIDTGLENRLDEVIGLEPSDQN